MADTERRSEMIWDGLYDYLKKLGAKNEQALRDHLIAACECCLFPPLLKGFFCTEEILQIIEGECDCGGPL